MKILAETTPIRELMPEGYTRLVMAAMGEGSASNISEVVVTEKITSKYWPVIEDLARATDAKAYNARIAFIKARILERGKENIKARRTLNRAA